MPKIVINEVDNTKRVLDSEVLENVVYIPGFSIKEGSPVHVPTLCRTVSDLVSVFGVQPVFIQDQTYTAEFGDLYNEIMYYAGDKDPAYFMAEQLLISGIPVVYERVNSSAQITKTTLTKDAVSNGFTAGDVDSTLPQESEQGQEPLAVGTYYLLTTTTSDLENPYSYNLFRLKEVSEDDKYVWVELSAFDIPESATITNGIPDKLEISDINVSDLYDYLEERLSLEDDAELTNVLLDKNLYDIQFLTAGGYPVFEYDENSLFEEMVKFAEKRGDCIAVIDHTDRPDRALVGTGSVIDEWQKVITTDKVVMFTPWGELGEQIVAPSFVYLMTLAESTQTNPNWLAVAGKNRGVVSSITGLHIDNPMTRAIADSYMAEGNRCINPIVPMGTDFVIWGNRTAVKTAVNAEKALYFLNMRVMVSDIKKQCYRACEQLMFEQNSDVLWINFKAKIVPLLERIRSSYGLSDYKIIKQPSVKRSKLVATIKVYPIFAVEEFEITVSLEDEEVNVEE